MAVYQGAAHLPEQLNSFDAQTHENWRLWASVDVPSEAADTSAEVLKEHSASAHILNGPGQGAAANFLSLMQTAPAGEIWAFSDQDDVWLPHKITRALEHLNDVPDSTPALYCSKLWITNDALGGRRLSPPRPHAPGFGNALVQNIASGNTIVLNGAASTLIAQAAPEAKDPVVHDWWMYQIVTGAGGVVIHDDEPGLLYRQHSGNIIGSNDDWSARYKRLRLVLGGTWAEWTDRNIAALHASGERLTPENRSRLAKFETARQAGFLQRIRDLRSLGLYRQSKGSAAMMWLAAVLGKL